MYLRDVKSDEYRLAVIRADDMCRDGAVVCGLYFFIGSAVVTSTRFCDSVFRDCYALSLQFSA